MAKPRVTVEIEGLERTQAKLRNLRSRAAKPLRDALHGSAILMQNEIRKILRGPRHGKIYKLRGGALHQASAPGEPPALLTGHLRASVEGRAEIEAIAARVQAGGFGAPYAIHLEFGTRKMAQRPFMRSTVRQNKAAIVERVRLALNQVLRTQGGP